MAEPGRVPRVVLRGSHDDGVAYYQATGKTNLLDIVKKNTDLICSRFGKGKIRGVPGHPGDRAGPAAAVRCHPGKSATQYSPNISWKSGAWSRSISPRKRSASAGRAWGSDPADRDYAQTYTPVKRKPRPWATASGPGICTPPWLIWPRRPGTRRCTKPARPCGTT